jgi:predicted metal-dependent hydrolase
MEYVLIRSNRKTIGIRVRPDTVVEVRAPGNVSKTEIDRVVALKQKWIEKHLAACKQALEKKKEFQLNYGDTVAMQGKTYPISERIGDRIGFDGKSFYLPLGLSTEEIKYAVIQIYKMVAKNLLTNKVIDYAKLMNVNPIAVKVNSAKTRWGSCSTHNSINFSWRLIMASDDIIDYVVVHELAHIREHNHSKQFWAIVESVLPDYKTRLGKLKELQKRLADEDWE